MTQLAADETVAAVDRHLMRTLTGWAAGSVIAGSAMWAVGSRTGNPALTAFGRQNASWGAIDGVIAAVGQLRGRHIAKDAEHGRKLRRLLILNSAADVGYVTVGVGLLLNRKRFAGSRRYSPEQAVGDGAAIVLQGGFLLVLDTTSALALSD